MSFETPSSNYGYARRGNACASVSGALTSNRKFIPPANSVYNVVFSRMLQYPGHSGDFITNVREAPFPEQIKAYRNKGLEYASKGIHLGHHGHPPKVGYKSCCGK